VGYTIRLESKCSSQTKLLFCTTGILLKRLEEDRELTGVTHVFVVRPGRTCPPPHPPHFRPCLLEFGIT
jgi:hypothetical protein